MQVVGGLGNVELGACTLFFIPFEHINLPCLGQKSLQTAALCKSLGYRECKGDNGIAKRKEV